MEQRTALAWGAIRSHFFGVIDSTNACAGERLALGNPEGIASYLASQMPSGRLAGSWL